MRDYFDIRHTIMVSSAKRWVSEAFGIGTFEKEFAKLVLRTLV